MTHTLAATIARAIFDRIERDRTLILQNIEEVIRDQLAIEGAKRDPAMDQPWGSTWPITERTDKGYERTPGETDMHEYQRDIRKMFEGEYKSHPTGGRIFADTRAFEERVKLILGPLIKTKAQVAPKPALRGLPEDAEGFYGDDWK